MMDALLLELENDEGWEDMDDIGRFWNPQEGESIRGICKRIKEIHTKLGSLRVMTLQTLDGEYYVKGHRALERYFDRIQEGWGVWITYNGKAKSQKGAEYHSYTVKVKKLGHHKPMKLGVLSEEDFSDDKELKALIMLTRARRGEATRTNVLEELDNIYTEGRITESDYLRIKEKLEA
ncbi:unknown [Methanobacterium phage psiM2]|uniref:Uncharacterized protein n=1 Tax=Methanobacterium phage psiM2 TaxID=77048 RepID=O80191_METM2|nr:hypothetical protein psiM2p01 [Methanobacterium phage psiM2]AAC27040.1 unknown [Methanobacterium phage psiM2]